MRKCSIAAITIAALGMIAEQAAAEQWSRIGTHGRGVVCSACMDAGGQFVTNSAGAHGCEKKNCDGKGGDCKVACSENQECYGSTPGRVTSPPGNYDLVKILKFAPARTPQPGLLEPTSPGSPSGPSGAGTPKPTAPAPVLR